MGYKTSLLSFKAGYICVKYLEIRMKQSDGVNLFEVGQLIASLGTDSFPPTLLRFIKSHVHVDNSLVLAFSQNAFPVELFREFDDRAEWAYQKLYLNGAYLLDPFYQACLNGIEPGLYPIRDIAPDRFFQSEYCASYYSKIPLVDEVGIIHPISDDWMFICSLGRSPKSGNYSARELKQLRRIEPLISALMLKHWQDSVQAKEMQTRLSDLSEVAKRVRAFAKTLTPNGISPREAEVASLIMQGHSNFSAAANLEITPGTVKVLRKRLYAKLKISSQNELYQLLFPSILGN
jgi:DNA-binding CsgD family transcriptional regulator